jgi:hypothetical protein
MNRIDISKILTVTQKYVSDNNRNLSIGNNNMRHSISLSVAKHLLTENFTNVLYIQYSRR